MLFKKGDKGYSETLCFSVSIKLIAMFYGKKFFFC